MTAASDHIAPLALLLNQRLVELDEAHGSDALATDVARALQNTLVHYRGARDRHSLLATLLDFHDVLMNCRPRMPNVIFDVQRMILHMRQNEAATLQDTCTFIDAIINQKPSRRALVAENSAALFQSPQVALVHSYSGTLLTIIERIFDADAAPRSTSHEVIVASQSAGKTRQIVRALQAHKVRHTIIPEYAVSHIIDRISIALFGALTLTRTQVILGPGSGSLLAQLERSGVRSYVALSSDKVNFWKQSTAPAFSRVHKVSHEGVEYERLSFSHDFVPLSLFTGLITERGCYSMSDLNALLDTLEEEFNQREGAVNALRSPV